MSEAQLDEQEEEETQIWASSQHLVVGTQILWTNLVAQQNFTNASPRYNEATLVRDLEKKGIGRPSTFASLVNAIVDKSYVEIKPEEKKELKILSYSILPNLWPPTKSETTKQMNSKQQKMIPTILGVQVYEFCMKEFNELFDYGFTKRMEDKLDEVERGSELWENVCKSTYDSYKDKYTALKNTSSITISNSKKVALSNGYDAVITRNGPCLVKDKKFLGWPNGVEFKNITDAIVEEFIAKGDSPDIFGYYEEKPLVRKKGKFGEYIVYDGNNISLKPGDTIESIIERMKGKSETLHTLNEFIFKKGPYGTYMMKNTPVAKGKKPTYVSIPAGIDVKLLTYEAAKNIYDNDSKKPKKYFKKQ
jgi:DNA topoisomerase-1